MDIVAPRLLPVVPEGLPECPEGCFRTIVADPPWRLKRPPWQWGTSEAGRPLPYPTLSVDEIKLMVPPSAPDAVLFLWTVNKYIPDAYCVARAWGFKPSTLLVWAKAPRGIGGGGTFTVATEYVLFCRKGTIGMKKRIDRNWWPWKRTRPHSRKPSEFLALVEQVAHPPYLEMFARQQRECWHVFGNEI